tara:strand:+ start:726 stop:1121 length:396 start_codon:yes stop_codon:yes gene_type:complete
MSLNLSGITYHSNATSVSIDATNAASAILQVDCNKVSYLAHEVDATGTTTMSNIAINNLPTDSSASVNFVVSFPSTASGFTVSSAMVDSTGTLTDLKTNLSSDLAVATGERLLLVGVVVNGVAFLNFQSYA